jgi:hypothetical protein
MDWIEHLENIDEKIKEHIITQLDNDTHESMLVKYLFNMARRNIDLFIFGAKGKSNSSYVDIMKIAIRRQIELNQKITLPFIKKIDPIVDLWKYELKKSDLDAVDGYWKKSFNFPIGVAKQIKQNASNYVHPNLPLKVLRTLETEELAQQIYQDCGLNKKCLDHFTQRLQLEEKENESLLEKFDQLIDYDLQPMMHFLDHFIFLMEEFIKKFIK